MPTKRAGRGRRTARRRAIHAAGGIAALAALLAACGPSAPLLQRVSGSPSDPRATFVAGNVTTCEEAGYPDTVQMGSPTDSDAADANVSGVVTAHDPSGGEVNITVTGPATVKAVIVKGGDSYNRYEDPAVLPPTLLAPQHYIAPLNGGGVVPNISHWFVCYEYTEPPDGALVVLKAVTADDSPAVPLPEEYVVRVTCDDGTDTTVTFGAGGGIGSPPYIAGITAGSVCTVVEDTSGLPEGSAVTYRPTAAPDPGVTVEPGRIVFVGIRNDYSGVAAATGRIRVVKELVAPPPGVVVPETFAVIVLCDDGTEATVTVPGSGGEGAPIVTVSADAHCSLEESEPLLAPGWTVRYSVDGAPATPDLPFVDVVEDRTTTITIVNDPTRVLAESAARFVG